MDGRGGGVGGLVEGAEGAGGEAGGVEVGDGGFGVGGRFGPGLFFTLALLAFTPFSSFSFFF